MLFEICVANLQSALAAQRAGAQRLELCTALDAGGLTPSPGLIRAVIGAVALPVHVLIRPREGDFCYDAGDLALMLDDIRFCREAGAAGVVVGALDEGRALHSPALQAMREAAGPLHTTYHRAFDYTGDPFAALETLVALGFRRVLSSGQAPTAYEGRFLLQKLVEKAAGRITVMPGAGISAGNVRELAEVSRAREFHLSGRRKVAQPNPGGDIPGLEWGYWASDETVIRAVIERLN